MKAEILDIILPMFLLVISLAVGRLVPLIAGRVKSQTVAHALEALAVISGHVVASLAQTVVDGAKVRGEFNAALASDVKTRALAEIKTVGGPLLAQVAANGMDEKALDAALSHFVESAVNAQQKSAEPPAPKPYGVA